jgi:NADH:ubiquinone oxidoreductase subunit 2 (subunit N)
VSTFYYLRIIKWMFFKDTEWFHYKDLGDVVYPTSGLIEIPFRESILLGSSLFVVLTFLLYPSPFLTLSLNVISSSFM